MRLSIERLTSTPFAGRRFTRQRREEIQAVVNVCANLSRTELGQTICEQMQWATPRGTNRIQSCLGALDEMEQAGLFVLPAKDERKKRGPQKEISWTEASDEQAPIACPLAQIMPVTVAVVMDEAQKKQNKEYIDRYHYLGYRQPIGPSLQYEIRGGNGVLSGFLLFAYATSSLPCRDHWLGQGYAQEAFTPGPQQSSISPVALGPCQAPGIDSFIDGNATIGTPAMAIDRFWWRPLLTPVSPALLIKQPIGNGLVKRPG